MHRCHCRNIFQPCISVWNQEIAPGEQGTRSTEIVCVVGTCEQLVRRMGPIWTAGQGLAKGGVAFSYKTARTARLEFSSGIFFHTTKGGKNSNNIKFMVFGGMKMLLTLNSLVTWNHCTAICSPAAAAASGSPANRALREVSFAPA